MGVTVGGLWLGAAAEVNLARQSCFVSAFGWRWGVGDVERQEVLPHPPEQVKVRLAVGGHDVHPLPGQHEPRDGTRAVHPRPLRLQYVQRGEGGVRRVLGAEAG